MAANIRHKLCKTYILKIAVILSFLISTMLPSARTQMCWQWADYAVKVSDSPRLLTSQTHTQNVHKL